MPLMQGVPDAFFWAIQWSLGAQYLLSQTSGPADLGHYDGDDADDNDDADADDDDEVNDWDNYDDDGDDDYSDDDDDYYVFQNK